jgi:hypothetical protein
VLDLLSSIFSPLEVSEVVVDIVVFGHIASHDPSEPKNERENYRDRESTDKSFFTRHHVTVFRVSFVIGSQFIGLNRAVVPYPVNAATQVFVEVGFVSRGIITQATLATNRSVRLLKSRAKFVILVNNFQIPLA